MEIPAFESVYWPQRDARQTRPRQVSGYIKSEFGTDHDNVIYHPIMPDLTLGVETKANIYNWHDWVKRYDCVIRDFTPKKPIFKAKVILSPPPYSARNSTAKAYILDGDIWYSLDANNKWIECDAPIQNINVDEQEDQNKTSYDEVFSNLSCFGS